MTLRSTYYDQFGNPIPIPLSCTLADFVQPAVGATVALTFQDTSWMIVGNTLFCQTGGLYRVTAITSATGATLRNLGGAANAAPGATIPAQSDVGAAGGAVAAYDRRGTVAMVAGTTGAIADTNITATSCILLTRTAGTGTPGILSVQRVAGVSFTVVSSEATDNPTLDYLIIY